ncbi:MAG: Hsp33 family molecular chaperone HslO [Chloroflexota bacterium]
MSDYLVRVVSKEADVRAFACITTDLAAEGMRRHQTSPHASVALGRGLTNAAIMGALLNVKQKVAIKLSGDGPLRHVLVESDSYGRLRGYVAEPQVSLPATVPLRNLPFTLGSRGSLKVVRHLGRRGLSEGVVELVSGDINQDIMFFLKQSDQNPGIIHADAILDDHDQMMVAGGLLIQVLPGKWRPIDDEEEADTPLTPFMEPLKKLPKVTDMLIDGETPESILATIFESTGFEYDILEKRPLSFTCDCSLQRSTQALLLTGRLELEALHEEGEAVVECHYCHEIYRFDQAQIEELIAQL